MRIFLIILFLGLCGCAQKFYKAGATQEQFNRDAYECKQQAFAGSMNNAFIARDLMNECMHVKGYTKE